MTTGIHKVPFINQETPFWGFNHSDMFHPFTGSVQFIWAVRHHQLEETEFSSAYVETSCDPATRRSLCTVQCWCPEKKTPTSISSQLALVRQTFLWALVTVAPKGRRIRRCFIRRELTMGGKPLLGLTGKFVFRFQRHKKKLLVIEAGFVRTIT